MKTKRSDILAPQWKDMCLSEIGDIIAGGTPSTSNPEYWDGSIAWVTPADLSELHTRHLKVTERYLTRSGLANSAARLLLPRSLAVSSRAPIGHMALPLVTFCTNQGCKSIEFFEGQDPDFHYFNLRFHVRKLHDKGEGTTFAEISKAAMKKVVVTVPIDEHVQKVIASILVKLDQAIEETEALLAKQQRIKAGLMHDLLTCGLDAHGELRDPSTHRFKNSRYGPIPVEWDVLSASSLCDAVIDCKNRTPPSTPDGHPVIRTPNVRNGRFVYDDLAYTDNASYLVWVSRGRPRVGDVVITREAPFGESCQIPCDLPEACLGQRMMMYQPTPDKLRSEFLVRIIYSSMVQSRLLELAGGSTVGHVRVGDIRSLEIPHPVSINEQERICDALNSLSSFDEDSRITLTKLCRLKTGLMHDLLTSEVSVAPLLAGKKLN